MNSIGIYRIVTPSGKCYVGMTMTGFQWRWNGHLKELRNGRHKCAGLKRAYAKYGEEMLKFEILEAVPAGTAEAIVLLKEQQWWDRLKAEGVGLYNGRPTATGSVFHTQETRQKMRNTALQNARKKFITNVCAACKKEWESSSYNSRKYCSNKCRPKRKAPLVKQCMFCGHDFLGLSKAMFCSQSCAAQRQTPQKLASSSGKQILVKLYLEENKSLREIAEELKVSHQTVKKYLLFHDIELRDNKLGRAAQLERRGGLFG